MPDHRPTLDYAPPKRRQTDLAYAVALPCAIIGVMLGTFFAVAATKLLVGSFSTQTNSVDRDYYRTNAKKLAGCALIVWIPSVWFVTVGRKARDRDTMP